jgi:hypothetical protein
MGALPKNKITRVEQGKRRAGNRAAVKKITQSRHSFAKQVRALFAKIGIEIAKLSLSISY